MPHVPVAKRFIMYILLFSFLNITNLIKLHLLEFSSLIFDFNKCDLLLDFKEELIRDELR